MSRFPSRDGAKAIHVSRDQGTIIKGVERNRKDPVLVVPDAGDFLMDSLFHLRSAHVGLGFPGRVAGGRFPGPYRPRTVVHSIPARMP